MLGFSFAIEATRSRSLTVSERVPLERRLLMNCRSSALRVFGAGAAPDRLRVRPLGFNALRISLADFCSAACIAATPANRVTATATRPTVSVLTFRDIAPLLCVGVVPSVVSTPQCLICHWYRQQPRGFMPQSRRLRSFYSIIFELAGNVLVDRLRGGDVGIAARRIAVAQLGLAAAEQGRRVLGIELERRVVVGNGAARQPDLQVDEAAAVECVDEVRLEAERFVAIPQSHLQVADDGACPAAVVERLGILGIEPDRVVEIPDRVHVPALLRMRQAALRSGEHTSELQSR